MKLAEALKKRKSLRERLAKLGTKLATDAYRPAEKPGDTLKLLTSMGNTLALLSCDIASANTNTLVETRFGPLSLLQARAMRDEFVLASKVLTDAAELPKVLVIRGGLRYNDETGQNERVADSSVPIALDTDDAFQRANQAARDARELDSLLQAANWTVEVSGAAD